MFHKGEHELQIAYLAQTSCDINGFIFNTEIVPANLHDSSTFHNVFKNTIDIFGVGDGGIKSIELDAGYKNPSIAKEIIESGVTPLLPYTRPKG
ncbi:MAG: hypothetical protein LBT75_03665 [Bacilli bacterium]|jgi:hypothetical protein|nr:hypothetical protein [Bacilli bacterium]